MKTTPAFSHTTALLLVSICAALALPFAASAQCPDATIRIDLVTDNYPQETSYQVTDRNTGAIVASGPGTTVLLPNTAYFQEVCVSSTGCYDFTIFDSFGDGICCTEGAGSYTISYNGTVIATGGSFTTSASVRLIGTCAGGTAIVTDNITYTPVQLINDVLLGSCVSASNITYTGSWEAIGYFSNGQSLGMNTGVLLTTGSTAIAPGPNNVDNATVQALTNGDAALETAAGLPFLSTLDAASIEFDFISFKDTVRFNYIFASEEYPEYVCSAYNDAFAFLVSGPGYAPNTNIALIPGTNIPVAINSVNNGNAGPSYSPFDCTSLTNTAYYVNNTSGLATEYDAYTVPLTATMVVVPCQTYHIKLVIADVNDRLYDSGVFLQAESFSAGQSVTVRAATGNGSDISFEGCFDANFVFEREDTSITDRISLPFNISGTALEGIDYQALPDSIIIPAGQNTVSITVRPLMDGIAEGQEFVVISYSDGCACGTSFKRDTLFINDNAPLALNISGPTAICDGQSATLTANASGSQSIPYDYRWGGLQSSAAIVVSPASTTTYTVTVTDECGAQSVSALHTVSVQANFFTQLDTGICNGDSFFVAGSWQTVPGVYYDTFLTAGGCDSIVETTLSILAASTTTDIVSICDGESYFAGGAFQTTAGTYFDTFSIGSCDSIVITELTVLPVYSVTQNASICEGDSFFAGGAYQTETGVHVDSLLTAAGCDSVITTNLTVANILSGTQDVSICDGESFLAGGAFQTQSGTYFDTLTASNGCDSVVITNLTVLPHVFTTIDPVICSGDSFFAGGASQTTGGTYVDTFAAANGCDSIVTTNLTVLAEVTETVDASICDGESYFAGGAFQTTAGTYFDTLVASGGCDSVVITNLTVSPNTIVTLDPIICNGGGYFAGGALQTVSGTYFDTLTGANGCDSIIITNLTVLGTADITVSNDTAICIGASVQLSASGGLFTYTWSPADGLSDPNIANPVATPQQTTTYVVTTQAQSDEAITNGDFSAGATGFSSGYTFTNDLQPEGTYSVGSNPNAFHTGFTACGDHTTGSGNMMVVNGSGTQGTNVWCQTITVVPNTDYAFSCWVASVVANSPAILQFSINGTLLGSSFNASPNSCSWQQFYATWNSGSSTTANICIVNQNTALGGNDFALDDISFAGLCTATDTVTITVLDPVTTTVDTAICDGDSYFAGGADQTVAGTYFDTLSAANTCDSIVVTNLTVLSNPLTQLSVNICDGESYFVGGADQTQPGTYFDTLVAANGCDSIIITDLFVLPVPQTTINDTICFGDTYFAGGAFQTDKGTYYDTLVAANGCDSIVVTNLEVLPNSFFTVEASICDGDSYFVGGADQTAAGIYYDTLVAINGCDSVVQTTLTLLPNSFTTVTVDICDGESHFAGGADQTTSGAYFDTLGAANGCDSIVTTNLVVHPNVSTTIDTTVCDGSGYFAGGAIQTASGTYFDTLATAFGCDSVIITNLTFSTSMSFSFNITDASCNGLCDGAAECTVSGGEEPLAFEWSDGDTGPVNTNLCAATYGVTATDANGCTASSFATVGEPAVLLATTTQSNISCGCANSVANQGICVIDFAGLPAGTILSEQYAQFGIHMSGDVVSGTSLDKLIVFNTNATGTQDPDLQVNAGNIAILPQNLTDNNGDGLVDAPNDHNMGGKQTYTFDTPRDVISFKYIDKESPPGTATAYDANGVVIKTVTIPHAGNGSIQTIMVNAQNVSKLVIDSRYDSGGVTEIQLGCTTQCCDGGATVNPTGGTAPYSYAWSNGATQQSLDNLCADDYEVTVTDANGCLFTTSVSILDFQEFEVTVTHQDVTENCTPANQLCQLDFGGLPAGTKLNEQYAQFGIHISGDAYGNFPDQIIIFDADATGTPDPDLEAGTGHLAIFPEKLTDSNGNGLVDNPNDQGQGGKMTFLFDTEREVISFVFVDKENKAATAKAYGANNNLIKTVNIPNAGNGSVQTIMVNASGVRRLVIDYSDSGGITDLVFGCNNACCDGSATATVTGGTPPFTYAWSNGGSTASIDSLCAGSYTVTVTDAAGCTGTDTFDVGDCSVNIVGAALVNDGVSQDIRPLIDGDVISLDTLCPFNLRVIPCQTIGSVKFKINGATYRVEEFEPFALAGDNPTGDYHPWYPTPGSYTIEAIPFTGPNASGAAGNTFTLHLTIVGENCSALKTSVENAGQPAFEIAAYPMPFYENVMIDVHAQKAANGTMRVIDILGKEIVKQDVELVNGKNTITLQTGGWLPGAIYFLEINLGDEQIGIKLVKGK